MAEVAKFAQVRNAAATALEIDQAPQRTGRPRSQAPQTLIAWSETRYDCGKANREAIAGCCLTCNGACGRILANFRFEIPFSLSGQQMQLLHGKQSTAIGSRRLVNLTRSLPEHKIGCYRCSLKKPSPLYLSVRYFQSRSPYLSAA